MIPFKQCLARPSDGSIYPLVEHLTRVAHKCGDPKGSAKEQLAFLAGLLHDAGKARFAWQEKIRARPTNLPLHSWIGAYLYAITADRLLDLNPWQAELLIPEVVRGILDIHDHHSAFSDVDQLEPPWRGYWMADVWQEMDIHGIWDLVRRYLPFLTALPGAEQLASKNLEREMSKKWFRWGTVLERLHREFSPRSVKAVLRRQTAYLVAADRFHAAGIQEDALTPSIAERALRNLDSWLRQRQGEATGERSSEIIYLREQARKEIMGQFEKNSAARVYTLELPTGMGKTLTGLRIGLRLGQTGAAKRIIYVAPYLSILSQAASEIRRTTGLAVLEHHHLSTLQNREDADSRTADLVVESWQAPLVVTTFNQFVRGLLPDRAQASIRLAALDRAVVIIDEPQIFEPELWNLLLTILGTWVEVADSRVILMSATMPPVDKLDRPVQRLETGIYPPDRYYLDFPINLWDEEVTAEEAVASVNKGYSTAVILNTIKDAVFVYNRCCELLGDTSRVINLHGAMTPLHKQYQIRKVCSMLKSGSPVLVISTQVLEAGVDLSFQRIIRARPILPSVVQAAGRANRHAQNEKAQVSVVDFRRGGEIDTRTSVYRNKVSREISDSLLKPGTRISEREAYGRVSAYFSAFFSRYPAEGGKDLIARAAAGQWNELGGIEVFKEYEKKVELFVPCTASFVTGKVEKAMARLGLESVEEIYEKYCEPGWLSSLDFHDRKLFMALMMQFTVPSSFEIAQRVATEHPERSIWRLVDESSYSPDTGLGGIFGHESDGIFW